MRHWNHRLKIYGRIRDEGYLQKLFACSTMTSNKQMKEGNRQMAESILVVDDEQEIADLVEVYLQNEGYTVHKFYNAKDALNCLDKTTISLALLDVMLPDMDGFSLCRKIKADDIAPVIFLTAKDEEKDVVMGLELGADDYVIKPFRNMELLSRIKNVLRRNRSGNELTYANLKMNVDIRKLYKEDNEIKLTKLEFEILKILLQNPKKVFTREEILSHIWDSAGNFVNDNTLTVTIKRLREKIGDKEGNIIVTVRGVGYRLSD